MKVRWEHLTPPEFRKLAKEEKVCLLPIGSLERHGEHLPLGTDALTAHRICVMAAEEEPCVVFPPYWFGQVHEASCFHGTVNFPGEMLYKMLETLLDQIALNGFTKILIVSGHGGNTDWLHYFQMTQCDRETDYTVYSVFDTHGDHVRALSDIWDTPAGGHADEKETSVMMAITPDAVKMEYQKFDEPILSKGMHDHLKEVHTGLWWYGKYPEQVTGTPSAASREKGEKVLEAAKLDLIEAIRLVKADETVPKLQKEFYERRKALKKF